MRADRLVSMVLLLRQRGRMSASALARELEVSTRTVLRDIEALSGAGVPVFAERGRHGGFELLPGLRTELTGLTPAESLALVAAGSGRAEGRFGLGRELASAMRKVVDALPPGDAAHAADAVSRMLVEPETDLLDRRAPADDVPPRIMSAVREAVVAGRRLRIRYGAADGQVAQRTVDPIGLVTVRGRGYLLATRDGADRTYRLSRITDAEVLVEPATRPERVDLERLWRERGERFRAGGERVDVHLLVAPTRFDELADTALDIRVQPPEATSVDATPADAADAADRLSVTAAFQDERHAEWAAWQLGLDAEVRAPAWLRASIGSRAAALAARYGGTG